MNKNEILEEINKTKEHLANMEKMLEECECKRWKPEAGDEYYFVTSALEAWVDTNYNTCTDIERIGVYNCFRTAEEAEQEAEKILIRRMLEDIARRLNEGKEINWGTAEQLKYYIDLYGNHITTNFTYAHKIQGTVYCLDENFEDVAIKEIGEERLKKYLRGE